MQGWNRVVLNTADSCIQCRIRGPNVRHGTRPCGVYADLNMAPSRPTLGDNTARHGTITTLLVEWTHRLGGYIASLYGGHTAWVNTPLG